MAPEESGEKVDASRRLIESLRNGRSALELLARLTGDRRTPLEIARAAVDEAMDGSLTDKQWRRIVHDGFVSAALGPSLTELPRSVARDLPDFNVVETPLELVFTPSDSVHDGRFANNGWLQETPDSITKLTWDNAAIISPKTARELGVEHATLVDLTVEGRELRVPAFILPGQADGSIGLAIGYGRTAA